MRKVRVGLSLLAATVLVLVTPPVANAAGPASAAPAAAQAFPSASSTVVGSVGFVDDIQVGYFWSAARGDSVEQTFAGKAKVKRATLKLDVPTNGLVAGAHADWAVSINGKDVGTFSIASGQTGPFTNKYKFKKIKGPRYDVKIYMTNEVAAGAGAHTLRYAGTGPHSIALK